jgi:hypothetical protein
VTNFVMFILDAVDLAHDGDRKSGPRSDIHGPFQRERVRTIWQFRHRQQCSPLENT